MKGTPITEQEADKLIEEGVAAFYDCPNEFQPELGFGGFFEAEEGVRENIILVITNDGYFIRAREDLVKSRDEVFVGWIENGDSLPNFEEIFECREL